MTIERTTRSQWEAIFAEAAEEADADIITRVGPIYSFATRPTSTVAARLNERVRRVSRWLAVTDPTAFDGFQEVLERIIANEEMEILRGEFSTTTLRFSRGSAPSSNLTIPRGAAVSGRAGSNRVVYVTTQTATLLAASAPVDAQGRFYVDVPARAVSAGSDSVVEANILNTFVSAVNGFDRVTNPEGSSDAADGETNEEVVERFLLAVTGLPLASPDSIRRIVREEFPSVDAVRLAYGDDPALTRALSEPGAVDAYAFGGAASPVSSSITYLGPGQVHLLEAGVTGSPLIEVTLVEDIDAGVTLVEGTDYVVEFDDSPVERSLFARDGIRFLASSTNLPPINSALLVQWTFDQTVRNLQARFDEDELFVVGRSLLWKRGTDVPIALEIDVTPLPGFATGTIQTQVGNALIDYVNGLEPGAPVERFDLSQVIGRVSGVDNVTYIRLTRTTEATGVSDLTFGAFERARLDAANLIVVV